ncbi:MAG: OmpH family outer membrane protein [Bacteroidia bacterium]
MKNASLALNIILIIAVAVLYYFHFSSPASAAKAVTETKKDTIKAGLPVKPSEIKASDIVYVNLDSLNARYDRILDASKVNKNRQQRLEGELQKVKDRFNNDYAQSEQRAQAGKMSEPEMEEVKKGLQAEQVEVMKKQEEMQILEQDVQRQMSDIQKTLSDFLARYNSEGHYRYIMAFSGNMGSPILLGKKELDITSDVLKGLNAEYHQGKKSK